MNEDFNHILLLIQESRNRAYQAVNAELVNLYWQVGQYVSFKLTNAVWGDKTVEELAKYIEKTEPAMKGFSKRAFTVCDSFMKLTKMPGYLRRLSSKGR